MGNKAIKESDLYDPVKEYFTKMGFLVKGEVKDCDVVAVKDELMIVTEMKLALNLDVILQASIRQRITDIVYIAVPKKMRVIKTKRFKNSCYLLRRLEIGLLFVSFKGKYSFVEEVVKPNAYSREMSKRLANKKRKSVLKEFNERYGDFNKGGITGETVITAYREKAIHIATLLKKHGHLSIKQLKEFGTDSKKTSIILQHNHYGWFNRVSRGTYELTQKGMNSLLQYGKLVNYYENLEED
nr:DUF2161 family putative PD-(D/E)XK-type phosphodiesterase [Haloplasma contractile]